MALQATETISIYTLVRGGLTTVHAVHANQAYLLRGPTFLVPFFYRRCRELTRSRNLVVVDSSVETLRGCAVMVVGLLCVMHGKVDTVVLRGLQRCTKATTGPFLAWTHCLQSETLNPLTVSHRL